MILCLREVFQKQHNKSLPVFKLMDELRVKKDTEGRYWFAIPVHDSSRDDEVVKLEKVIFKDWLKENNYHSEELLWLLDYSCRDDFGLGN